MRFRRMASQDQAQGNRGHPRVCTLGPESQPLPLSSLPSLDLIVTRSDSPSITLCEAHMINIWSLFPRGSQAPIFPQDPDYFNCHKQRQQSYLGVSSTEQNLLPAAVIVSTLPRLPFENQSLQSCPELLVSCDVHTAQNLNWQYTYSDERASVASGFCFVLYSRIVGY